MTADGDVTLNSQPVAYIDKTYDFYYKADNIEEVLNEKIKFNLDVTVENAMRFAIKTFNKMLR